MALDFDYHLTERPDLRERPRRFDTTVDSVMLTNLDEDGEVVRSGTRIGADDDITFHRAFDPAGWNEVIE